jgi:hypothetical protein
LSAATSALHSVCAWLRAVRRACAAASATASAFCAPPSDLASAFRAAACAAARPLVVSCVIVVSPSVTSS